MAKKDNPVEPSDEIIVGDPQLLRPTELPLVIKPAEGKSWKNPEQEEYAKTLNAAAYINIENWNRVKDVEIARLKEIGEDPSRFYVYSGVQGNLSFPPNLPGGNTLGA